MSTKDISDLEVLKALVEAKRMDIWPYELLEKWTGQPEKVCFRALERCHKHGYLEYGVSLRTAGLSEKGKALLQNA